MRFLLPFLLIACGDKDTTDTGADTDTGTDTDTDTIVDGDLSGSVRAQLSVNGETVCDVTVSVASTGPYTGTCDGCDYAFEVDTTVTEDNSTADDCVDSLGLYLHSTDTPAWGFATNGYLEYYGAVDSAIYSADSGAGMQVVAADGISVGYSGYQTTSSVAVDGASFTWDRNISYSADPDAYAAYCGEYSYGGYVRYAGTFSAAGDLSHPTGYEAYGLSLYGTDGSYDVWTLDTDGGALSMSVDTVSKDTAFDPFLFLSDGSTCLVSAGDDNFDCTHPPPQYACPSAGVESTDGGTWYAVVGSYGSGVSPTGSYSLLVEHDSDPNLTLLKDDARQAVSITVSGTAAIE